MSTTPIQIAVLTVSDTASTNAALDKSGPTIRSIFSASPGFVCPAQNNLIVPDDRDRIQAAVRAWSRCGDVDCIITTGGTGFGVRDVTPEAISPLIEREASGLVHLLLSSSLQHTPLAALSRPVAGTVGKTLVVTLPGSVKAVKENLDALLQKGILEHAIDLIRGGTGQRVHAALASSTTSTPVSSTSSASHHSRHHHHHHHHHGHATPTPRSALSHDPSASTSARHRQSPYPLVSLEDALGMIREHITPLPKMTCTVNQSLIDHILAEDVYSLRDEPPLPTTSVDGYALRSTDPPGIYNVLKSQTLGEPVELVPGSIYRINTGGTLPPGADTVIMVEDTRLVSAEKGPDGSDIEEKEVETLAQIPVGENVRAPGSDVRKGDLVLQEGDRISSGGGEIGTLAFVGRREVSVYKKPIVAILSTGNEVADLHSSEDHKAVNTGQIYDTNRPSLLAALQGMGYEVVDLGIVPDDINSHTKAIRRGLKEADVVVTTGGTSMGPTDLLKPVIERFFDGTVHFGRVTVKPGKPTTFATVPFGDHNRKAIFALPGNPASALVTFNIFVVPALRRLGGWKDDRCHLPRVRVKLQSPMTLDPRTEFHRVIIRSSPDGLKAFSTGGQRSSRVASLSGANGLVILPPRARDSGSPARLEVGTEIDAVVIGEIQML